MAMELRIDERLYRVADTRSPVGELEMHDSPIGIAASSTNEVLVLEPIEHSRHRAAVHVGFACERGDRVGAREEEQQQRLPLHRGELERLHALIDAANERRVNLLDEPA